MSSPSATAAYEGIGRRFPLTLLVGVLLSFAVYFTVTWTVDPYGVSPLKLTVPGINQLKPKRLDIDRQIKPLEVWQKQPKTVFLGTSRIHQSMDPSVLDGTDLAPAYNASVPAVALAMNISYLERYAELDSHLHTVFAELFFYYFVGQGQYRSPVTVDEFIKNGLALYFSGDALRDSWLTVIYNALGKPPTQEIASGGNRRFPPGLRTAGNFSGFPAGIWALYAQGGGNYKLHEPAFEAVAELIKVARTKDVDLVLISAPNHAYFDYFLDSIDAWGLLETCLTKLAEMAPLYSFSQPNSWVYEEVRDNMKYWNDPFHFSLEMGRGMQLSILGKRVDGLPANFMTILRPQDVHAHIETRRAAIRKWALGHPSFVASFREAREKAGF